MNNQELDEAIAYQVNFAVNLDKLDELLAERLRREQMMKRVFQFDEDQFFMVKFAVSQFVKEQTAFVKSQKADNKAGAKRRLQEAKELLEFLG